MMTTDTTHSRFVAGDFVSEDAVRGALGRRRRQRNPSTTPTEAIRRPMTGEDTPLSAGESPVLRRWSVAELIARAVAARRADGMGYC
jgi:hypothetical protein